MDFQDQEIEEKLVDCVDEFLSHSKVIGNGLSFQDNGEDGGYNALWNHKEVCWDFMNSDMDLLSLYLLHEHPERVQSKHEWDNEITLTLSRLLDRSCHWIESFQYGWYGKKNEGESISGYILGRKLRRKYI